MKIATASLLLSLIPGGVKLSTEYKPDRVLRMEIESTVKMETATLEIVRDGEPMDAGGGGLSSETVKHEVHVDTVVEAKEGLPTKIRRNFEKLSGKWTRTMGDNSTDTEIECPLDGVTLEIRRDADGKTEVSVAEGKAPDGTALENHVPENFLDGLLPEGEKQADSTWDLDSDAIRRALRLDVSAGLYPKPEREEDAGGGEGGGRRRRGMRSGGDVNFLQTAEWKGKAKLVATDKEVDGKPCAVIELKLESSGDLPEPDFGGRRGDRSLEIDAEAAAAARSTFDVSLEGKLVFAIQSRRPVSLDLEGSAKTEIERESTRDEHTMKFHVVMEGEIAFKVAVAEEKGQK